MTTDASLRFCGANISVKLQMMLISLGGLTHLRPTQANLNKPILAQISLQLSAALQPRNSVQGILGNRPFVAAGLWLKNRALWGIMTASANGGRERLSSAALPDKSCPLRQKRPFKGPATRACVGEERPLEDRARLNTKDLRSKVGQIVDVQMWIKTWLIHTQGLCVF